jgi:hypothetical protein
MSDSPSNDPSESGDRVEYRRTLILVRYVLPALLVLAGLIMIVSDSSDATVHGGMGVVGAGLAAFLFAFLAKVSMGGDRFRDQEEEARRYFDEHGRWPDDE